MLNDELIRFCNRWLEKAEKYGESTEDVFDKFFSLFVVYNAIYFEVTQQLRSTNKSISCKDGDSAIQNIPLYIGQDILSEKLFTMLDDINQIIGLIKDNTFHIFTKYCSNTPNHNKDALLISNIEIYLINRNQENQEKFNEAILSLIYGARCNMFHGNKKLQFQQIDLLVPMNNILEMIIKDLLLNQNGGK